MQTFFPLRTLLLEFWRHLAGAFSYKICDLRKHFMRQHFSIVQVFYNIKKLFLHCLKALIHKSSMENFHLLEFI